VDQKLSKAPRCVLGLVTLALAAWVPAAWSTPVVTSQLQVSQVVHATGGDVLKPAAEAKPGDILQYRSVYANGGTSAAAHLLATLPVPAGTTLQASGVDPSGAEASVDGKTFAPMPLMHSVVGKDGTSHQEPVPLADIRALRWDLGTLAPHDTRAVQLRVHVNTPAAATAAADASKPASSGS